MLMEYCGIHYTCIDPIILRVAGLLNLDVVLGSLALADPADRFFFGGEFWRRGPNLPPHLQLSR